MGVAALAAVGLLAAGAGTYMSANSASKKRKALDATTSKWLPTLDRYTSDYFGELENYAGEASELSSTVNRAAMGDALALQEQAIPGITAGRKDAASALFPLLKGELPQSVLDAFSRSGAANSGARGFMGDQFLTQGLFGARGALGAMEFGYGILPQLLGSMPNVQMTGPMNFLGNIMNPTQRTNTQLAVRGQNMGVSGQVAQMDTSADVWGGWMSGLGGMMMGGAMMGGGIPGMGGAGKAPSGNPTRGYMGTMGGAEFYNVPTTYG